MDAETIRERDSHLVRLLEAIQDVQAHPAWSTLKEEFDGEVTRLNRLLLQESKKAELNLPEIYRYQGRLEEAKRISLDKLKANAMTERSTIKQKLL